MDARQHNNTKNRPRFLLASSIDIAMRLVALFLALSACLSLSCSMPQASPDPRKGEAEKMLSRVQEGMSEAEVLKLLGPPSEKRSNRLFERGESQTLAYGVRSVGGFAEHGIVDFDRSNRVEQVCSPTCGYGIRRGAWLLPTRLDIAHPTSNILCVVTGVVIDPSQQELMMRQRVLFSLINQSDTSCSVPTPLHSLSLCIAVEVYDKNGHLFFRKDNGTKGMVTSAGPKGYPSVTIGAGSRVDDEDYIWLSPIHYGKPPPGAYYVRVAFGFSPFAQTAEEFTTSKVFKFVVH